MFTREQQQNFMMELNGWGIQFDSPTINAYLRDKLLAERFPELPEDGRAHIIDQVRQLEAEEEPFLLYSNDNHQPTIIKHKIIA